ncbi:MAG: MFS transporter [Chloroflexi bacterium]|nr:MAG: MFS transporter [Chloroflexota bacterium]
MSPRDRRTLVLVLGLLTFASVYASVVMAPVLTQIAGEFGISTGAAGLVVAAYGAPGIVVAVAAGPYSDRFGRKRFLVAGAAVMGVFTLLASFATTFPVLVGTRMIAGVGGSVIFPNANATLADHFPYSERARAIATVIGMNTMASIVGIPIAGIVAEATSWRVSVAIVGVLCLAASIVLFFRLRPVQTPLNASKVRELYRSIVTNRSAIGAVGSSLLGALYWFSWSTYIVVFFEQVFGLSQGLASSLALLYQTNLTPPLAITAVLNLALSAVIGARFASNTTLLTEQVPEARGTMLALSASVTSASIVAGASIGGILIDVFGFGSLGVFCFAVALIAALVVALFVREEPIDLEISPAA